ncbi:MAG: hypothetical protein SFV51_24285 [Bryobacteraceae bacterium]|nr:hypothetical protein [Bryobacteraceae bacterium]
MKTFWTTLTIAAMAALVTTGAVAQRGEGRPDPARMVERQVSEMKDRLKLTDDQTGKVKEILTGSMKKMAESREKYGRPQRGEGPSEEMMADMRKNREETDKKLGEVLSKEQMTEYGKMMSERRGRMGGPGGPGGRGKKQ